MTVVNGIYKYKLHDKRGNYPVLIVLMPDYRGNIANQVTSLKTDKKSNQTRSHCFLLIYQASYLYIMGLDIHLLTQLQNVQDFRKFLHAKTTFDMPFPPPKSTL